MRSSLPSSSRRHLQVQARRWVLPLLLGSFLLVGCDTNTHADGVVQWLTAPGEDPWTTEPAVKRVQVDFVQGTKRTVLAAASTPSRTLSIGQGGPPSAIGSFEATGLTDDGSPAVRGTSIPFFVLGFSDIVVPLFVARTGGFSAAPNPLLFPHSRPLSAAVSISSSAPYLAVVDPNDSALDLYSTLDFALPVNTTPLPQTVKSLAVSGSGVSPQVIKILMINDDTAAWLDLSTAASVPVDPPAGLAFADVSGGKTWVASDGTSYIVGATRTEGAATKKVLRIDTDYTLHTLLLATPRLGAAAALVDDALLVAGGSSSGTGAELYPVGAASFQSLKLPADETQGAALVRITSTTAWLVGGHDASGAPAQTRLIDVDCTSGCAETPVPGVDFDLSHVSAFQLDPQAVLVLGETEDEQNHAYLVDTSGDLPTSIEQPLHTPRARASAVRLPNGQVAWLGGTDLSTSEAALGLDVYFR